jgi:L-ascorbate metabolism protein UlaG (beta-lactamase superfamily)
MEATMTREASFTWYGHACVEVQTPGGKVIQIDPWYGNPKSPKAADDVARCDLMLVTHGHSDHVGESIAIARRTSPEAWPAIHELSLWLGHQLPGRDGIIGMNKGGTVSAVGLKVTMTRAEHSAGSWSDATSEPLHLGEPAGFVVELEDGFRFYHAGDTDVFGDMELIRKLHQPELAFLPIGGHYTMDPHAAALAVELLGVRHVVPIHYGTFPILAGTPEQLRHELDLRGLANVQVHALKPGESLLASSLR